jgi:monoamine oxidase
VTTQQFGRRRFLGSAGALAVLAAAGAACGRSRSGPIAATSSPTPYHPPRERSVELAREMLQVGDNDSDLKLQYLKVLIDTGLPRAATPKRIIVIGAGPAGLTAAKLLVEAGHQVTVLEGNANRTGGRVKTFRGVFSDPALYAEAGAMRLPDAHPMVLALADKLGVRRRQFFNADVLPSTMTGDPPSVLYRSFTGESWSNGSVGDYRSPDAANRTLIRVNGMTVTRAAYAADPATINKTFGAHFTSTSRAAFDAAVKKTDVAADQPIGKQIEGWADVFNAYEYHSMHGFLLDQGWELAEIEAVGTLENLTSRLSYGVIPTLVDHVLIRPDGRYWELQGGTAALTDALTKAVGPIIRMGKQMTRLEQTDRGVRVWTIDTTGKAETGKDDSPPGRVESFDADYAIVAIPLSAARFCSFDPPLSYPKRRAIIELHQDAATKVLLEFKTRFWEQGPGGFRGGGCVSDLPNRFTYFPSHVDGPTGGVVLASYTWSDDALRWDSLTRSERVDHALAGMREIFGNQVDSEFTGVGISQSWMEAKYALGEAVVPTPGQLHEYHEATRTVEGLVHFAGDHTTLKPAWIEGALESAVRAALEVNNR